MLSSNMLLLILILLIDVTLSTPTGDFTLTPNWGHQTAMSVMALYRQLWTPRLFCGKFRVSAL